MGNRYINDLFGYCADKPKGKELESPIQSRKKDCILVKFSLGTCKYNPRTCEFYQHFPQLVAPLPPTE